MLNLGELRRPIWLLMAPLALLGWFLFFIGVCLWSDGILWWWLLYNIVLILGVLVAVAMGAVRNHRVAVSNEYSMP
jgi:ABC-type multidrug transport system permease subunit